MIFFFLFYHKVKHNKEKHRKELLPMERKYLNTAQTAKYFGVTTATILNWQRQQILPCLRIGRTRRFALSDIQEFERENRTGS